jgi:nifR3 family TIM-barrel protein
MLSPVGSVSRSLAIGGLTLESKLMLAPMVGVTQLPFRRIARRLGCGLTFAEMVKDEAVIHRLPESTRFLAMDETDHPVGAQLLGREPTLLARAARILEDCGADLIDINLGCPAPAVVRNGEGAALLREPDRVACLVEAVVRAVSIPVTVKIRRGVVRGEETAPLIAARAEAAGAAAVTVHGRYAADFFRGQADWGTVARVREVVRIPVVGNGDVTSGLLAHRLLESTGCRGVMVGRGAVGRPWIFREILDFLAGRTTRPLNREQEVELVLEHLHGLVELLGPRKGTLAMRRHAAAYFRGMPGAPSLRARVYRATTPSEFERLLRDDIRR